MAQGSVAAGIASVAATTGTYDIKPGAGVEWVVHNVYAAGSINLSMTDGTNTLQFDSFAGADARMGMETHVTNTYWLRVSNTGASAVLVGYDGIQTSV